MSSTAIAHPLAASRSGMQSWLLRPWVKPVLFIACLLPLLFLLWAAAHNELGPNPAERLIRRTGDWSLRFLCLTLAVTPLRQLTGWAVLARWRRMLGLYSFFYVCLHFFSYAWLDMGLDVAHIAKDIGKRPFILVGVAAWLSLMPLAATSFNRAIKAMGAKRWQALHRAVYLIAGLALLHFYWMRAAKHNFAEVKVYALIVAVLLAWRLIKAIGAKRTVSVA